MVENMAGPTKNLDLGNENDQIPVQHLGRVKNHEPMNKVKN